MSDSMIEKVAAALFDRQYNAPFGGGMAARMIFGKDRITYAEVVKGIAADVYTARCLSEVRADARAAIEAMREATPEMCEAGFQHTGDPCWPEDVGKAWSAMIDAALSEKP